MTGSLCLQGGREFTEACEEMDRTVLETSGATNVVVLAGAARVGDDHDGAVARALAHYRRLGVAGREVPDPRVDRSAAIDVLGDLDPSVDLVVLPGGSPTSLLDVLTSGDGRIADLVTEHHRAGGAVSGASAGAMVMCSWMVRPDRDGGRVEALGLVDGLALPHWTPGGSRGWDVGSVDLWGLPECGGASIVAGQAPVAVGQGSPARRSDGEWVPLPRSPRA